MLCYKSMHTEVINMQVWKNPAAAKIDFNKRFPVQPFINTPDRILISQPVGQDIGRGRQYIFHEIREYIFQWLFAKERSGCSVIDRNGINEFIHSHFTLVR